jgi:hypothetical protein
MKYPIKEMKIMQMINIMKNELDPIDIFSY